MDALIAKADAIRPFGSSSQGGPGKNAKRKRSFSTPKAAARSKTGSHSKQNSKRSTEKGNAEATTNNDYTLHSVSSHTALPKSLSSLPSSSTSSSVLPTYNPTQVPSKKLRTHLHRTQLVSHQAAQATEETQQLLSLAADDAGGIQLEGELEKTWRLSQDEVKAAVGGEAAGGRREIVLDSGGVKRMRWTRNGRHLAFISGKGGSRVSSVDWLSGSVNGEVDLTLGGTGDGARDVTFLQDQSFFAVAQRRNVFVYDKDGVEVHQLKNIVDPVRLEFLPWHWLLVAATNSGHLSYTDTTTGTLVALHRTKLGSPLTLTQNPHTAVSYLGHGNGCVTLWTPNLPKPAVQLLAHLGSVTSVGVDPSDGSATGFAGARGNGASMNTPGRYMATAGRDGKVKIWDCRNWKGVLREWTVRGSGDVDLEWSQRGYLGVLSGGSVNVYHPPAITTPFTATGSASPPPPLYITHPIPHRPLTTLRFEPFSDVLAIGHDRGLTSILVPGSGEPQFDSLEADPFESAKARREREVKGLLDKIKPDMISLDPSFVGRLDAPSSQPTAALSLLDAQARTKWGASLQSATGPKKGGVDSTPYARMSRMERLSASGKLDRSEEDGDSEDTDAGGEGEGGRGSREEKEKKKMRGKNKALKRYLRKQRKNVVDPTVLAIRAKVDRIKAEEKEKRRRLREPQVGSEGERKNSALDRFKKRS